MQVMTLVRRDARNTVKRLGMYMYIQWLNYIHRLTKMCILHLNRDVEYCDQKGK